jgi:hypothetical protein
MSWCKTFKACSTAAMVDLPRLKSLYVYLDADDAKEILQIPHSVCSGVS